VYGNGSPWAFPLGQGMRVESRRRMRCDTAVLRCSATGIFRNVRVSPTREANVSSTTRARLLFSPWWRVAWLIGGIVWAISFNVAYISAGAVNEWLGLVSVVPIVALLVDVIVRVRRWRRERP